ncbi:iron-sulfur-dependent L-serine dehydratase [Methylocaldum marinum]|uniref:L-serine dehydratase n=1 Tax=Methylocaldum marinum TaxID=1432792 RepID=A0A286P3I0_9GAMM|nr:L-serine ammonia-lyase [Methylocaldum marinum]BBA32202.1 iron-sulfur-dependent L-serine dehydratase [Methylocaldum marinum]
MDSISAFEIIKVGIGPSSSHTMGPWRAALLFLQVLGDPHRVRSLNVRLYGSLAKTGRGHGTDVAVLMGLSGEDYTSVDPAVIPRRVAEIKASGVLPLGGKENVPFIYERDLVFESSTTLARHPNAMHFRAILTQGGVVERIYFSLGGGFVASDDDPEPAFTARIVTPYPCHSGQDLLRNCKALVLSVSDLTYLNEQAWRSRENIAAEALRLWREIQRCVFHGVHREGYLPGGLRVRRRAPEMHRRLLNDTSYTTIEQWSNLLRRQSRDFANVDRWVVCFALAVSEENASFGRIVTAPTNGAAGVIPAVLMYAWSFLDDFDEDKIVRFILTAGEIGTLFKKNATISAAMGGCQAEIGVSSAMAAAGLAEVSGGSPEQVLQAAEIAMEHHLGLTCDPVGGLVQIPCIERNTMGAVKAITAATIALDSDPLDARVSLDAVIQTMWETAQDMNGRYKETAEGGLAVHIPVNVPEC